MRPIAASNVRRPTSYFFLAGARCLSAGHHLRLTRGPAGNRTTTGSLSASSRTMPYQLSHEDTSKADIIKASRPSADLNSSTRTTLLAIARSIQSLAHLSLFSVIPSSQDETSTWKPIHSALVPPWNFLLDQKQQGHPYGRHSGHMP